MNKKRAVVLAPHGGDGEFGAGGLMARLVEEGCDVHEVVLSLPRENLPEEVSISILEAEVRGSAGILGVRESNVIFFDFEVREFSSLRQRILDELVRVERALSPDLVLCPSSYDTHQDHEVVFREARRAFKKGSILGYEMPRNHFEFGGQTYVVLTREKMERKMRSLARYVSQKAKFEKAATLRERLAGVRGSQIAAEFAECYETIRWVF